METQLLRTFLAVAETGSMSAAATQLGYAQSSVSEQVGRLERELGTSLLTRTSTGVTLSPAGQRLLPEARSLLASLDEMLRTTRAAAQLRVGTVDTLASRWLPGVVATLRSEAQPTIGMERRDRVLRGLVEGRYDVAILFQAEGGHLPHLGGNLQAAVNRLAVETLDHDERVVVHSPEHAANGDAGWLVTQRGCVLREVFDLHVAPGFPDPLVRAEAAAPDALRRLAVQGSGRALLPSLAVADDLASGTLVVDESVPGTGSSIAVVAAFDPDAGPEVQHFLRRAIDVAVASAELGHRGAGLTR